MESNSKKPRVEEAAKKIHAYYCFEVLENYLTLAHSVRSKDDKHYSKSPKEAAKELSKINLKFKDDKYPVFVTWNIRDSNSEEDSDDDEDDENIANSDDKDLRGCIGTFQPGKLATVLYNALQDPRFPPVGLDELPYLTCGVSLLTNFEDGADHLDFEIGKHGIVVNFIDSTGENLSATYLPDVIAEIGKTKEEILKMLVRKAGYRGNISEKLIKSIKIERYQSSKIEVTFKQYKKYCKSEEYLNLTE